MRAGLAASGSEPRLAVRPRSGLFGPPIAQGASLPEGTPHPGQVESGHTLRINSVGKQLPPESGFSSSAVHSARKCTDFAHLPGHG